MTRPYILLALLLWLPAGQVSAHSFGKLYNLPVPFWMYLYGAAAALILSFFIVIYFVTGSATSRTQGSADLSRFRIARALNSGRILAGLRVISVGCLWLTIFCGLIGSNDPYSNFNMTFFWIVFVLGFAYLTALIGNLYAVINPWRVMCDWLARVIPQLFSGRIAYPPWLGYYPALGFYFLFIWVELFAATRPLSLAVLLAIYTAVNFFGAWLVGVPAWFKHCEFFAVFLRLIGLMSPLESVAGNEGQRARWRLRPPFIGLLRERAEHLSLLLFVLFMLSSTAFDGLRETLPWVSVFWQQLYPGLLAQSGGDMVQTYPLFQTLYGVYQTLALLLSPFFYLLIYLAFIALAKQFTGTTRSVRELALQFAFTLIPIAVAYHITHYYTLIETQGLEIVRLISDPLGRGWNLFGTAHWRFNIVPDAGVVWHTQIGVILFGHIVGVYLAHLKALEIFSGRRQAALSQLPMLLLMVAFTSLGLWILSQPLSSGQI